uniref:BPTI/Kunitz inhibitor domain-containing protein n=1 Tax=Amblyomma triste TaxID=251400 RepID=A0A023G833_AMBTT
MYTMTCFWLIFCLVFLSAHGLPNEEICNLDAEEGRCPEREPPYEGWYFESKRGYCGRFKWDACGGNDNQFSNCTSCMKFCTGHPEPEKVCREVIGAP